MDQVERAALGCQHIRPVQFSQAERAEPLRVAEPDDLALAHEHDRKRPFHPPQRGEPAACPARLGEQVQDDFAVHGGLENRPAGLEFGAERGGICEVPVVGDGQLPARGIDHERLRVFRVARSGRRVAHVPDRPRPGEPLQLVHREHLRDEPHAFVELEGPLRAFRGHDPRALLSPVLQGEQPVVGQQRGIGMAENAENAAFIPGFVLRGQK